MSWRPINDTHAIERMGTIFQFASPAPSKLWNKLIDELGLVLSKNGLAPVQGQNDPQSQVGGPVPVGPPGLAPLGISFMINGLIGPGANPLTMGPIRHYRTVEGREEVFVQPSQLLYVTTIYDRWISYHERLEKTLRNALDSILEWTSVSLIKLECWDRFTFDGPAEEANYGQLLKIASPLVPSFAARTRGLWHSHVGFYVPGPAGTTRLYNLNFDVVNLPAKSSSRPDAQPSLPQRSVGIYSMLQDSIAESPAAQTGEALMSQLTDLHTILNRQFGDVMDPEIAAMISLQPLAGGPLVL